MSKNETITSKEETIEILKTSKDETIETLKTVIALKDEVIAELKR